MPFQPKQPKRPKDEAETAGAAGTAGNGVSIFGRAGGPNFYQAAPIRFWRGADAGAFGCLPPGIMRRE